MKASEFKLPTNISELRKLKKRIDKKVQAYDDKELTARLKKEIDQKIRSARKTLLRSITWIPLGDIAIDSIPVSGAIEYAKTLGWQARVTRVLTDGKSDYSSIEMVKFHADEVEEFIKPLLEKIETKMTRMDELKIFHLQLPIHVDGYVLFQSGIIQRLNELAKTKFFETFPTSGRSHSELTFRKTTD